MSIRFFPSLVLYSVITMLCILIAIPSSYCDEDELYAACNRPYTCGQQIRDMWYPFWGNNIRPQYCGRQGFELKCNDNQNSTILFGDQSFQVLNINMLAQKMIIARNDLLDSLCSAGMLEETIINHNLFSYGPNVRNISLFFACSGELSSLGQNNFSCTTIRGDTISGFYIINGDSLLQNRSNSCKKVIKVPFLKTDDLPVNNTNDLLAGRVTEVLKRGFEVEYRADNASCSNCLSSLGICGSNQSSEQFVCLCRDQPHTRTCPSGNGSNLKLKLGIGLAVGISAVIATISVIIFFFRVKNSPITSMSCFRKISKSDQDLEEFIRNNGPLALKRYSFSEVGKMTSSFKDKLGQGGFGGVYKGKLSDGHLVAVKLLNTTKGNGQDFINEVASISRTSHINVVTLLGYCLEGSKRALIYEFMPNGSLEKFRYNGNNSKSTQHLGWEKMYEIMIGIARGLEYLHRGCNTRILHFDIKPQNILLDEDFCPKISDFGLAKLCLNKESIVSILEARGTIGYIAPEVFSRNFGEVSHKSDVYSYGMMILELVGCKNNLDAGDTHSSEIYFPYWVYRHVEQSKEFKLPGVVTSEENEIAKKMIIVGLWCIQARPSDRPPMNKVIEMLQLSIEDLQIPPTPFLSSPPRPPIDSFTMSTS